jgi:hypothetical protein
MTNMITYDQLWQRMMYDNMTTMNVWTTSLAMMARYNVTTW